MAIEPFLTLGKASLHVFCTHIVFVFIGLAFLVRDVGQDVPGPAEELHGVTADILLVVTFAGLFLVAIRQVRKGRPSRRTPASRGEPANTSEPPESGNSPDQAQLRMDDSAA